MSVVQNSKTPVLVIEENGSTSPPPTKKVRWGVEDPSEYRPAIENMGKEQESFRLFDDVSQSLELYTVAGMQT